MSTPQSCSGCPLYRGSSRTVGVGTCLRWDEAVLAHDHPCSDWQEVVSQWGILIPLRAESTKVHDKILAIA